MTFPGKAWSQRDLIWQMTVREVGQKYRGSYLGMVWSFLVPIVMLVIYTFVFSLVFKSRWTSSGEPESLGSFALTLFAGLAAFNLFSEVVTKAPLLILGVPNLVKKVVFPLEFMPVVLLLSSGVNMLISIALILVARLLLNQSISPTVWLLPVAAVPLVLLCLGLAWLLSSLGVYLRDAGQAMAIVVQVFFFLSPIFYPVESIPDPYRDWMFLNPLTSILYDFRRVLLWGQPLDWGHWAIWTPLTAVVAVLGYTWFMKTKRGFADVM